VNYFGSKYTLILDILTEEMLVAENFESVVAFWQFVGMGLLVVNISWILLTFP